MYNFFVKEITLILTIYKQSLIEIDRWLRIFSDLKNLNLDDIDLLIVTDNPDLQSYYYDRAAFYNFEILNFGKNYKRVGLIKKIVDEEIVKSKYIKLCDPDDHFDIKQFKKTLTEIKKNNDLFINISSVRINKNYLRTSELNFFSNSNLESYMWSHPVNFNSMYITEDIKKYEINTSFNLLDDVFLFSLSLNSGRKIKYLKTENFYIWSQENGESNESFVKSGTKKKIYEDYDKYNENLDFIISLLDLQQRTGSIVYPLTNFIIKTAQNNLISCKKINNYFSITALFRIISFTKKFKKLYNQNRKFDIWWRLSIYLKTLFGRKM